MMNVYENQGITTNIFSCYESLYEDRPGSNTCFEITTIQTHLKRFSSFVTLIYIPSYFSLQSPGIFEH